MQTTSTPTTYTRQDIILMLIHRPADAEIPALDQPATFDEVNDLIRPLIGRVHASEFVRLSGRQAERLRTEKRPITRASLEAHLDGHMLCTWPERFCARCGYRGRERRTCQRHRCSMSDFSNLARAVTSDTILHAPVATKQHVWQALCEERGIRLCPENLMRPSHVMCRSGTGPRTRIQPALQDVLDDAAPRVSAAVAARLRRNSV